MSAFLCWNRPSKRELGKLVDPLGFDSLREAMADELVPWLTGGTQSADDYLWTLIGLKWAEEEAGSAVDSVIFDRGFAIFERALKYYRCREGLPVGSGVNEIRKTCQAQKPDLSRQILFDQRNAGLLGAYVVSLRSIGLVESGSIRVVENERNRLLGDIRFTPGSGWRTNWYPLESSFDAIRTHLRGARSRLGNCLFSSGNEAMTSAALSLRSGRGARYWNQVDFGCLTARQARIAKATGALVALEDAALEAFGQLLQGGTKVRSLRAKAKTALSLDPFPQALETPGSVGEHIRNALNRLVSGEDTARTLLGLHVAVMRDLRQGEPWISELGDRSPEFAHWKPGKGAKDFRFTNLQNLLRETKWRPDAD